MKKLPVGRNGIVAFEVLTSLPLCFCTVYMPSRNSKQNSTDAEEYLHLLDQLKEILYACSSTHVVLILGDINVSLRQGKGNNQDALLKEFVDSNNLTCKQENADTFFHPNKSNRAEIDYILSCPDGSRILIDAGVVSNTSTNTSDHIPVLGTLSVSVRDTQKHSAKIVCKPKWDICDNNMYQYSVQRHLLPFDTFLPTLASSVDILHHLLPQCCIKTGNSRQKSEVQTKINRERVQD